MLTIYHNNRCSKSCETLDLLYDKGEEPQVIEYLKTGPTEQELKELLRKLGMPPEELVRKGEALYKEQFAGKVFSDDEWIKILSENPVLMERPIVVKGDKAVIGRPSENVLQLL